MIRFACLLFLCLSFATATIYAYTPCEATLECDIRASPEELENVSLILYQNDSLNDFTSALIGNATSLLDKIDFKKPTIIYISGWTENPNSLSVATVLGAYFKLKIYNVILVNYEEIAAKIYTYAAASVDGIGYYVATAIDKLVEGGLNLSTLHVVGHSLGGQTAGYTGRYVKKQLPRITGLDPAGPSFEFSDKQLSFKDAKLVDIIHTNGGFYGSITSNGTVNFYPNGGSRFQPGCPKIRIPNSVEDFCDHHRSWYFYAESVGNENAFPAIECDSYLRFIQGSCSSNVKVNMGYATPTSARGNFYLQTNAASPFGRGNNVEIYRRSNSSVTSVPEPVTSVSSR